MFVNRMKELDALNREYQSEKSSFSIIYGRRRVGKTALITEYIKDKPHIYLYITQGDLRAQLDIFVQELAKFVDPAVARHLKFERFEEVSSANQKCTTARSKYVPLMTARSRTC